MYDVITKSIHMYKPIRFICTTFNTDSVKSKTPIH